MRIAQLQLYFPPVRHSVFPKYTSQGTWKSMEPLQDIFYMIVGDMADAYAFPAGEDRDS